MSTTETRERFAVRIPSAEEILRKRFDALLDMVENPPTSIAIGAPGSAMRRAQDLVLRLAKAEGRGQ